jgi:hypothetical protein
MPVWNDLFVRDSFQDTGSVPSPGYPYYSPDIICTGQTQYQQSALGATFGVNPTDAPYKADLNQVVIAQQPNFFYGRALNLGSTASAPAKFYAYAVTPSLTLTPGSWIQNNLVVPLPDGKQQGYADLPAAAPNQIAVTQVPLVWNNPLNTTHYCAVGICSTAANLWDPTNPPTLASWADFVQWVREHQTWCWRNLQLIDNPNAPELTSTAAFANPYGDAVSVQIIVSIRNAPPGTTVSLTCPALPGFVSTPVTGSGNFKVYGDCSPVPADFTGLVITSAQGPPGGSWSNVTIDTQALIGMQATGHPAERFDGQLLSGGTVNRNHPSVIRAYAAIQGGQGVLLPVGINSLTGSFANAQANQANMRAAAPGRTVLPRRSGR